MVAVAQEEMTPLVLIDDNSMVRAGIMRVLSRDYAVISFANPLDALMHLQALDYEPVIVCDYEMPELNGIEVYEKMPERFRKRFILHTGRIDVKSPSGHTIYKPSSLNLLREKIAHLEAS